MRIAKFISNSGYCSRRDAEKLISQRKVYINNKICLEPNINVSINDKIEIDKKKIILRNELKLWKFYKPVKIICTNKDPQKRKTIFDILPKKMPRVISIGRLDYMSEGLLLLTNNGDYARKMELPSSNIIRIYKVFIKGSIDKEKIDLINKGIKINKIIYKKIKVKIEKKNNNNACLIFKLKEGKNREIRKICEYFNWYIIKLICIQYGKFKISNQKPGEIMEVKNLND